MKTNKETNTPTRANIRVHIKKTMYLHTQLESRVGDWPRGIVMNRVHGAKYAHEIYPIRWAIEDEISRATKGDQ